MTSAPPATTTRFCRQCGYDLRVSTARCPECGRAFDPTNPRTTRRAPPLLTWRRVLKRISITLLILVTLLAIPWLVLYWSWHQEQRALTALGTPAYVHVEPISPWLRNHLGPPGFVLDRVTELDISHQPALTDLRPLSHLHSLICLDIQFTSVTDLTPLRDHPNLEVLIMSSTPISDLSPLAGHSHLQLFYANSSLITDLSPIAGNLNLHSLDIRNTPVTDFTSVSAFHNLTVLELPRQTTDSQLAAIRLALPRCNIDRE